MKKIFVILAIALLGIVSCQVPTTGGKIPAFDSMSAETQVNVDRATKNVIKYAKDSSGTLLERLNKDSITIEIGNTGESFTLKK